MNKCTLTAWFFFIFLGFLSAQNKPFSLRIQPVYQEEAVALNHWILLNNGDSIVVEKLQCYWGKFRFWQDGIPLNTDENRYYLFDLASESTHRILWPEILEADSLCFWLGVDSLTTSVGAMSGDLDPTKGMFWAWQSGYINVKIEGYCNRSSAKNGFFEFHLGGYLPPYAAANQVALPISNRQKIGDEMVLEWDFSPFFSQINWEKAPMVMSPGQEAQRLSSVLAKSFRWYAP